MKLIGIEEHFLTAEVRAAWNDIRLEAIDPSAAAHSGAVERRLLDLADERVALMEGSAAVVRSTTLRVRLATMGGRVFGSSTHL
jgi:hypothetical protein